MQLVLAQVSDAEALQRYEDACKDAEETDVLPFRLQYADMSAFLKAQTDWPVSYTHLDVYKRQPYGW